MLQRHPAFYLLMALWFGIIIGFGEVSIFAFKKFYQEGIIHYGVHLAWMAPVAEAGIFSLVGGFLSIVAWRWPRLVSVSGAASIFMFLGFFSMLFLFPSMAWYADLILAAGIATEGARFIARSPQLFCTVIHRSLGWLIALVAGVIIGIYGWQWNSERLRIAQLPPPSPGLPNVLLVVLDTVRAQNLSLYGYQRSTTPNLEKLASTGVVFRRALSTAPWTLPSHASIFTGHDPHEMQINWQKPLNTHYPMLAEELRGYGYLTAGFVANLGYCSYEFGLDRGFIHYEDYILSATELVRSSALARAIVESEVFRKMTGHWGYWDRLPRKNAAAITSSFSTWLDRTNGRPFFAFLNYIDAHDPYLPPEPFTTRFGPEPPWRDSSIINRWKGAQADISPLEARAEIDAYDASIAYLDQHIGLLFYELRKRGLAENTIVIITADHGEHFGGHGIFSHADSLYLQLLNVPLFISYPLRVPAGERVLQPVSLRDLPATIMDLIQVEDGYHFPGNSLLRYWDGRPHSVGATRPILSEVRKSALARKGLPNSEGNMQSLIAEGLHYIKDGDGREELYDYERDPLEKRDLSATQKGRAMLERFRLSTELMLLQKSSNGSQ